MTCEQIDRQVRALLGPYPRAFVTCDGSRIPVRGVVPLASPLTPREVVHDADGSLLPFRCADGVVCLIPDSSHGPASVESAPQAGEEQERELPAAGD